MAQDIANAAIFDLEPTVDTGAVTLREADWGEMRVSVETYHVEFDTATIMQGAEDDACQCPHWGYVVDGEVVADVDGRDRRMQAGEAYYLPPGHNAIMKAGTRLVNFSPTDAYEEMMTVVASNADAIEGFDG